MLKIDKKNSNGKLVVALSGKLDTITAPDFESGVIGDLKAGMKVTIDMKDLLYVSSAGLRELLMAKKAVGADGSVKLTNVSSEIQDVLEITGFSNILDVE